MSTIEHKGNRLENGHYISYILMNENWYLCNDSHIETLAKGDVAPTKNIYVMLLKRSNN